MKAIYNGLLVLPDRVVTGEVILYEQDIWKIMPRKAFRAGMCSELMDAQGGFVFPGFINEHIHGCAGVDTMDGTVGALRTMQKVLPQTGVTSFLPTTMTMSRKAITTALDAIRQAMTEPVEGGQIVGAHMEGPFISPAYKGAQAETYIAEPDFSWIQPYQDIVKIVTVAPEMIHDDAFLRDCEAAHIIVSLGHSNATYEEAVKVLTVYPYCHSTHLYNAMSPFHHRKPGLVGASLLDRKVRCELICDNLHVHPVAQKLAYTMKGADGIILITDSMRAALLPDGTSELGGQTVYVRNGEARLADGTLAGSTAAMNDVALHFLINTGATLPEIAQMTAANAAKDLGIFDRVGSLEEGKQADIVIVDSTDFHVKQTVVAGNLVYSENP